MPSTVKRSEEPKTEADYRFISSVRFCTARNVVAQKQVAAKSNEITAVPDLLEDIDIRGRVITADAMHTQKKTVSLIKSKGAHFLGQVKDNQPTLSEDIDALKLPESFPPQDMRKRSRQA